MAMNPKRTETMRANRRGFPWGSSLTIVTATLIRGVLNNEVRFGHNVRGGSLPESKGEQYQVRPLHKVASAL